MTLKAVKKTIYFSKNFNYLLAMQKMSIKKFSEKTGISLTTSYTYQTTKGKPQKKQKEILLEFFGKTEKELIFTDLQKKGTLKGKTKFPLFPTEIEREIQAIEALIYQQKEPLKQLIVIEKIRAYVHELQRKNTYLQNRVGELLREKAKNLEISEKPKQKK